jgi:AcrR family transcriptional regulator
MTDKETSILNATLQLISRCGFHDTPMSAIAREAEVGVGTIYRYFDHKEELIAALYMRLKSQLAEAILDGYSADLPLRQRFQRLWVNVAHYHIDHPLEASFLDQYANSPFPKSTLTDVQASCLQPFLEFVEDGVYEGVIKDLPLEVFASLTGDVAISLARKHRAGTIKLNDLILEQAMDACWDAVKR